MYAPERQVMILDQARLDGRVDVTHVAARLGVTPETIRRDLTVLERKGKVRRVHGGAIPIEKYPEELRVEDRESRLITEKKAIARRAIAELHDASSLIIDAGTTTATLAEYLPTDRVLTVVTHSVTVAERLAGKPNIHLYLLGGMVRDRTLAAVGNWTQRQLAEITVDVAFVGINGLTTEFGLSTRDSEEAAVKAAIIASATRSVILADHTKFGANEFAHVAPLTGITTIITDSSVDETLAVQIAESGPEVITA